MATLQFQSWQRAGLVLLTALCVQSAYAQDKAAPAPAPMAAPAPAPVAAPAPMAAAAPAAEAPKKKRYIARRPASSCTKLDDPWDNLCAIQKKATIACADLPTGKRVARSKRGAPAPVIGNPRKECVDSYMRNV